MTQTASVQEVNTLLTQIFPDPSIRDYVLTHFSDIYANTTIIKDKYIHIWTGTGDNGRTIFESLIKQVFNGSAVKLSSSTILDHQTTFTYDLVSERIDKAKIVFIEPSISDRISGPLLKQLVSDDGKICMKQLYHPDDTIYTNFHLHLICDTVPNFDQALWHRIRVIPFESTFCIGGGSPSVGRKRTFQRDVSLRSKIPGMVNAMIDILIDQYKKNHMTPEPIILETKKYKERNKLYDEFCKDLLTHSEGSKIQWTELLVNFQVWYKNNVTDPTKIDSNQEIQDEFCRRYGMLTTKRCFKNIAFKEDEDVYDPTI